MSFQVLKNLFYASKIGSSCRFYSKNVLRRKAIRVLNVPEDPLTSIQNESPNLKLQLRASVKDSISNVSTEKESKLVPYYEKLQRSDSRFTKTIQLIKDSELKEINGKILLEGKRLINDAIDAGLKLQTLYFSREKDLVEINYRRVEKVEIFKVLYKTMQLWSELTTCPGVMGVFHRPSIEDIHAVSEPVLPVNIICDNIKDPGIMGSIIRNAASAGCENIFLMKGCVDPWDSKVLKAACGGHFRIPIINKIEWTHLSNYLPEKSQLFIVDDSGDIEQWEETPEFINYDEDPTEADNSSIESPAKFVMLSEHNQALRVDKTLQEQDDSQEIHLPCYLYSSVKYPRENIVLYIDENRQGVDSRIIKLACEYGGRKIKLPVENIMNSLSSSYLLTIILYEIKRQLSEKYILK